MARFDCSTTIKRPVEDVFAVMSDFSTGSKWASAATEPAQKTSEGPIGVGSTWHVISKVVGRRIETDVEYTEFEANRKIAYAITKPFPLTSTVTFEPVADGTRVSQIVQGEPAGFFKLAEPLTVKMSKRQFQGDLDNLRDLMDANAL
jgi:uncharacterized protein YndB with AHSA1/START domain